jgi:hypothetical protein
MARDGGGGIAFAAVRFTSFTLPQARRRGGECERFEGS